jgi:microcystin-dependent protein
MADPFLAEIRVVGFNFAPTGWAQCDGQLLPISQNTALFALLGTVYGGDGKSTFALPYLQGSVAMHPNTSGAPGLSPSYQGEMGGVESVTLLQSEIPMHTHVVSTSSDNGGGFAATDNDPGPGMVLGTPGALPAYAAPGGGVTQLAYESLPPAGGGLPHSNLMPYVVMNFVIAMQGVFPQRP